MTDTYNAFCANLSASVKLAFELVGGNKYIPATPFHPVSQLDIWGSIAALYPIAISWRKRSYDFANPRHDAPALPGR